MRKQAQGPKEIARIVLDNARDILQEKVVIHAMKCVDPISNAKKELLRVRVERIDSCYGCEIFFRSSELFLKLQDQRVHKQEQLHHLIAEHQRIGATVKEHNGTTRKDLQQMIIRLLDEVRTLSLDDITFLRLSRERIRAKTHTGSPSRNSDKYNSGK